MKDTLSPGAMTAVSILTIIAGTMTLLMVVCGGMSTLLLPMMGNMPGMEQALAPSIEMMQDPLIKANAIVGFLVPGALACVAIAAGVGLLKLRPWGRKAALVYAIGNLIFWFTSTIVNIAFIAPRTATYMEGLPGAEIGQSAVGMISGLAMGFVLYGAMPIVLLIVLNREGVRERFEPSFDVAEGGRED